MQGLSEHEVLFSFLAFAILLLATRSAAELARRFGQPEVLGELMGGFLVGPSVLGALAPRAFRLTFSLPAVAHGMSLLSWFGAILLLLIAGIEADLVILREKALPGLLAATGAIGSSIFITTYLATHWMGRSGESGFCLGVVCSVTAVSVTAKLLIDKDALRRGYSQVLLAAGIASEIVVWPMLSVLSALHDGHNPVLAGIRSAGYVVAFFAAMLTGGRRVVFWAMRRVAASVGIANGDLSLILILVVLSGTITAAAGLHPLLGAFAFGVLLSRAPRATVALKERIQTLTVSFVAPIFFGLAGMRVNLFDLHGASSIRGIVILLFIVGLIKITFAYVGARVGRLSPWESASVATGLNLKGGTDVVVAIVGAQLGLLSTDLYTMYAVVAILTVLITPPILSRLTARAQPSDAETERLNHEEAKRRAYFADMERVLVPEIPELHPELIVGIVGLIAEAKNTERELFDITELTTQPASTETEHESPKELSAGLQKASALEHVSIERARSSKDSLEAVLQASQTQQIIFVGSHSVRMDRAIFSFGDIHDELICKATCDVLLSIHEETHLPSPTKILIPVNGLEHSLAAADVAAYIAKACNAELVLFNVAYAHLDPMFWKEGSQRDVLQRGYSIVREAQFRVARLGVWTATKVKFYADPAEAVLRELGRKDYGLVVMGGVARANSPNLSLGNSIERVMREAQVPRLLLVSRGTESGV
jgi:Kef-type K+ transport system membrane component KefB/nucleotide-binding universal stress UspA family protein